MSLLIPQSVIRNPQFRRKTPDTVNSGYEYQEQLGADAAGRKLLDYLCERYAHSSREQWRARIETRRVLLAGSPAASDVLLVPGQLLAWRRPPWREPAAPAHFAILYIDREMLGVAKPSGLPTVPGGDFLENTLLYQVKRRYPEADPLHRLGRCTSGVVLFARTPEARRKLSAGWREGKVTKIYRALISGSPLRDDFTVDVPIGPVSHPILGSVHAASDRGKPSLSRVRVLERRNGNSLAEISIATGRPHQIRVHMAAAGHPLTGDPLYARGGLPIEGTNALPGDGGYFLHSIRLEVRHPTTGEQVEISCSPPVELRGKNF